VTTLVGFVLFYSALLVIDVYLMVKTIKTGPGDLPSASATTLAALPAAAE